MSEGKKYKDIYFCLFLGVAIVAAEEKTCHCFLSDAIDDPNASYTPNVVEADESSSEQVPVEPSDIVSQQHVAVVTQEDGTQQQVTTD